MESFHEYLKQFPHYTPKVYEAVRPFLSTVHIDAGTYFLPHGSVCRHIAFIEEGLMRLYYYRDGKEVTQCFCKERSISTAYHSLITQQPSDVAIQAIESSSLVVLSHDSLQRLYEKNLFWQQLGRIAAENELLVADQHNRFLNDLTAEERYQYILDQESELLQRVPLNYLASYLQLAPETLSRIRKKMADNRN